MCDLYDKHGKGYVIIIEIIVPGLDIKISCVLTRKVRRIQVVYNVLTKTSFNLLPSRKTIVGVCHRDKI